jgi:hypothetical protein
VVVLSGGFEALSDELCVISPLVSQISTEVENMATDLCALSTEVQSLSTMTPSIAYYQVSSLEELTGTYGNGDIAVVLKSIGTSTEGEPLSSYTAYVYSESLSAWKAMDGNYNANNVYFDYNITKAGSWLSVGNISHTANTVQYIESSGKSLAEVMDMIFKGDEAFPAKAANNKPTCSVTQTAQTFEVGSTTKPKFTLSFDSKKFAYGSNTNSTLNSTTGVSASGYKLTYVDEKGDTQTLSGTSWTNDLTATNTLSILTGGAVCSGAKLTASYNPAGEGLYIPKSNLQRVLSSETELATYRINESGEC